MDPLAAACAADLRALAPTATDPAVQALATDLVTRWAEPQRHYHDLRHLAEMLVAITELASETGLAPHDLLVARVAAWFHDAIYDPTAPAGANERASAELALTALEALRTSTDDIAAVVTLVDLTTSHDASSQELSSHEAHGGNPVPSVPVFLDADLWILAAPPERFDEYCAQVRREYAHVPDDLYAAGRSAILGPLADRDRLYATEHAHARWDAAARLNLARERRRLS
ncbi:hypothetical protein MM440_09145 [Arsenicicoccus piscis]|uniref:Metal-dependent phosphohydrolase n=1 Tax=Arsenicicoccus piscis TaxID=673954 RepID=A0ABQ6HQS2_9MICO|nr:hypothetical protein [Arsenicicoccus piscis]MCH8627944.1 hypothetical protein [Arsenicicoccus piscis]GMA20721.1 hypothetical protein GCM10025862_27420 [Arsenicicoccus piscis]